MREFDGSYVVLCPDEGVSPSRGEIEAVLDASGLERWDGNGWPSLVVMTPRTHKGDYFEAGYWAGQGVPLIFFQGGHRHARRGNLVQRFNGWKAAGTFDDLLSVVRRVTEEAEAHSPTTPG
jgi:hypothetical protein